MTLLYKLTESSGIDPTTESSDIDETGVNHFKAIRGTQQLVIFCILIVSFLVKVMSSDLNYAGFSIRRCNNMGKGKLKEKENKLDAGNIIVL